MIASIALFIIGLALTIMGAEWLVSGASAIARKAGLSEFVIGLTIVGFGTSCPEMVVSFLGSIQGNSDISVGNVIGSNICNTLLILGLTAVMMPVAISSSNKKRDIPLGIATTLILIAMGLTGGGISRMEGIVAVLLFMAYLIYCFKSDATDLVEESEVKDLSTWAATGLTAAGLASLILGGRWFVNSAVDIAHSLGVSDKFIAITILALGTSLPELATCVVAAAKKQGQLALGNILGSNMFNILLILGGASIISPISFAGIDWVDMGILLASTILVFISAFTHKKNTIDRLDGTIMLLCEAAYTAWLIIKL